MAGLQEAVNNAYKPSNTSTCLRCKSANIIKNFSVGRHMMLDIEDVGNPLLLARRGYPNCRRQFTIEEVPDKLIYDKYTYKNMFPQLSMLTTIISHLLNELLASGKIIMI